MDLFEFDLFSLNYKFRLFHKTLKDSKLGRGVNMVAVDSQTLQVKILQAFDTYAEG